MLRRKNRLVRTGRTQEAGAIAKRVRAVITRKSSSWLRNADTRKRAKTWAKVHKVIRGRKMNIDCNVDGLTAQALNDVLYVCRSHLHGPKLHRTQAEDDCISCKSFHHGNNSLSHAGPSPIDSHWARCGRSLFFSPWRASICGADR